MPFFSISGSDFVEMFVGVGASRVRDLFEQGKKNAPCIIFIDEIDAVGRHRGAGLGGGHDEREQTLNQLLVEMDGFESNDGVILIAATNRPDVLDPALLRPGRFDRRVVVDRPDMRGREEILRVHCKKVPLAEDVDLNVLARGTPGFSGADLANLVNEAALTAARYNSKSVHMIDFEQAKDKVLMGAERKSMVISDEDKQDTAYHEAGHVLVAAKRRNSDPLHKVTIIPRGRALGVTMQLPEEDKHTVTKDYLDTQLAILMGGRCAEEIFMDRKTTGAGNDIVRATELARKMVCEYGMSDLGPLTYGKKEQEVFLGRDIAQIARLLRRHRQADRRGRARLRRRGLPVGLQDPRGERRHHAPHGGRAAGTRDPRPGGDRPHHRGQGAAALQVAAGLRRPRPRRGPEGHQAGGRPQAGLRRRPSQPRIDLHQFRKTMRRPTGRLICLPRRRLPHIE